MGAVPGYQVGLKLWSLNTGASQREARRLYDAGGFDYLELYAVPGSADALPGWKNLQIPCIIHAAHFMHGFNLARADCAAANRRIYDEMRRFADELEARYIIFHGGTFGCISETARQLAALHEPRALIENKPCITRNEGKILQCRGASVEEIRQVLQEAGCGFCLDIPHALCAANYLRLDQMEVLHEMNALHPTMYHLADMMDTALRIDDHTRLGQGVLDMARFIPSILAPGAMLTIETNRTSPDALREFELETRILRRFTQT
ncbi:MAG: hypothetical protein J6J97_00065 [Akkermansia sp.]|nr:hypothetical protein [Akkermansia sp.]